MLSSMSSCPARYRSRAPPWFRLTTKKADIKAEHHRPLVMGLPVVSPDKGRVMGKSVPFWKPRRDSEALVASRAPRWCECVFAWTSYWKLKTVELPVIWNTMTHLWFHVDGSGQTLFHFMCENSTLCITSSENQDITGCSNIFVIW